MPCYQVNDLLKDLNAHLQSKDPEWCVAGTASVLARANLPGQAAPTAANLMFE